MAENSTIEWTHHTFNPWIGCTKVSPACDHCYAEAIAARFSMAEWGSGKPRILTGKANWTQPHKWNRRAEAEGKRYRVFCASMADVFDNEVPDKWRDWLWGMILETPHLDWLLLTKRIGNAAKMLLPGGPLPNVWLGISVVNQEEADRDIPKLLATSAKFRFLSMEPLLGPVNLHFPANRSAHEEAAGMGLEPMFFRMSGIDPDARTGNGIDWVIVGGESGAKARAMEPDWPREIRDQCTAAAVPFFFKQWGEWAPYQGGTAKHGKKAAGRLLDGREWNEFPAGH